MSERALPYNKVLEIEDFADPGLAALMREVFPDEAARRGPGFPAGSEYRKHWEVAMTVRALGDFGVLRRDAAVLGVGAGAERTLFHLTRHAGRVVATDLYLAPGAWERDASPLLLADPERASPVPFERDRLTVQHMDGRVLRFPDATFDAVFSSSSIEHFGDLADVAAAAYEMGRVLRPGGILTLATEFRIAGPAGSRGWPGTLLFAPDDLRRAIVEASGLEPVDELITKISERTLATRRDLGEVAAELAAGVDRLPHLLLVHAGQLFGSVHLTLRKTERYPVPDNAWARPGEELRERVRHGEAAAGEALLRALASPAPAPAPEPAVPAAAPAPPAGEPELARVEAAYARWDAVRARGGLTDPDSGSAPSRAVGFLRRTLRRVRDLGLAWDLQRDLLRALIDQQAVLGQRLEELGERDREGRQQILGGLHNGLAGLRDGLQGQIGAFQGDLGVVRNGVGELREGHESLRARQHRLEGDLTALDSRLRRETAGLRGPREQRVTPLSAPNLTALFTALEAGLPERAQAVEVSIQDARAEELLLAAQRHFGARMSSSGPVYRSPNDLWIHLDFTEAWSRPILLENAAARLAPGGRFLLVTSPGAEGPARHPRLELLEDCERVVEGGVRARCLTWRTT
jgi:SAM-dependent methyltransferase